MAPNPTAPNRAPLHALATQLADHWEAHDNVSPSAMADLLECVDFPTMTHAGRMALVGAYRSLLDVMAEHCAIDEISTLQVRIAESLLTHERELAEMRAAQPVAQPAATASPRRTKLSPAKRAKMTATMLTQLDRIREKNPRAHAELIDHIGDLVTEARAAKAAAGGSL